MNKQKRILDYFKNPSKSNSPEAYIATTQRSVYLVRVIQKLFVNKEISILELGSGTGRNLIFLKDAGYSNVVGIEQSPVYLKAMNKHFPALRDQIIHGLIEETNFRKMDLIFTMAVLEHIPDSPIFDKISKSTRFLLTIEDEKCKGWRHYPRNYKDVFESRGSRQVKAWRFPPLGSAFVMRLFDNRSVE